MTESIGLEVGHRADLVVWETGQAEDIIATMAPRRLVVKRGKVTVEHEPSVKERWRGPH